MAESIGIDTSLLFTVTFALGSGLAALGGGLGADILAIYPGYAVEYLVYFLMVVSVGGLGLDPRPVRRRAAAGDRRHRLQISGAGVRRLLHLHRDDRLADVAARRPVRASLIGDRSRSPPRCASTARDGSRRSPGSSASAVISLFSDQLPFASQILITILFALSLDLVLGFAGIVTLGHAAFYGTGAYAAGIYAIHVSHEPLSGLLVAAAVAPQWSALSPALSFCARTD